MLKKKRSKLILSSIVILLPVLFGLVMWDKLPDTMITHWGANGNADGTGTKLFAVLVLPVILWILHLTCLFFTVKDNSHRSQNQKALNIIYWIVPFISLFSSGLLYASALGKIFVLSMLMPVSLGILLVFIGNYLPKIKQNRTLGIKIPWTLRNEENWNRTHRLGGKVWVICSYFAYRKSADCLLYSHFWHLKTNFPIFRQFVDKDANQFGHLNFRCLIVFPHTIKQGVNHKHDGAVNEFVDYFTLHAIE